MTVKIDILVEDPRWKGLGPTVRRAAEAALGDRKVRKAAVTIALSGDAQVRVLNKAYRKKDKPTNVLSFPNGDVEEGMRQLGDIILAYETIAAEAAAQGKALKAHVSHLVVHGVLHLLGFDHEAETDAGIMEACEIAILARMGIANPYETA